LRARLKAAGTALLVSFHDFSRTKNLEQAARRIEAFQRISSKSSPRPSRWPTTSPYSD